MRTTVDAQPMRALAPGIGELTVDPDLDGVLDDIAAEHDRVDSPRFLRSLPALAAALPPGLRSALADLRGRQGIAALVLRSGPVREPDAATPTHWREHPVDDCLRHDLWLALVTAALGHPMCWSSLQDGRVVQDVLPIRGEEEQQTGHGSHHELAFHVEDCFHDRRCDILALLCLRNPDGVPTTVATVDVLDPARLDLDALTSPAFRIHPDPEHLRGTDPSTVEAPPKAVLSTDGGTLCLRVDPVFTEPEPGRAARALDELHRQLQAGLTPVALAPGDLLLVDNHRAVHGRSAFRPRYDGNDRWLRKITTTYSPAGGVVVVEPFA